MSKSSKSEEMSTEVSNNVKTRNSEKADGGLNQFTRIEIDLEFQVSTTSPPAGEEEPTRLSLKVKSQDGVEILFKVKRTTKLGKLMQSFADKLVRSTLYHSIRLAILGERVLFHFSDFHSLWISARSEECLSVHVRSKEDYYHQHSRAGM